MFTKLDQFIIEKNITTISNKVAVHHWYTNDPCYVSIKESKHGKVLVSHDIEGDKLFGCPDWWVNTYEVIGPITQEYTNNINESKSTIKYLKFKTKYEGLFTALYFGDKGSALRYRTKKYPDINNGENVYEIHIDINPEEQGKGLAVEMLKSLINKKQCVLWFSHGRVINDNVYKVINKFRTDNNYIVKDYPDGITIEINNKILERIQYYHGSTDKNLEGKNGIHVGTKLAATQALQARIGVPAFGEWDGTREYGKTLLAGKARLKELDKELGYFVSTGFNFGSDMPIENYYPTERKERAKYSDGSLIPMDCKPIVFPVDIVGAMTNSPYNPHKDNVANGMIMRNLRKGNAKSGYYYINDGEDSGSISAVVPNKTFLQYK